MLCVSVVNDLGVSSMVKLKNYSPLSQHVNNFFEKALLMDNNLMILKGTVFWV